MEAKCKYHTDYGMSPSYPFVPYKCEVMELGTASGEEEIKSFTGAHEEGKSNEDVTWLSFFELRIKRIPKNLHQVFPNLRHLRITQCDIEELTREDLKGLENLEDLDVYGYHHKITSLPDDLFADMKKLRDVTIFASHLEQLSSKILLPIKSTLEFASFYNQMKYPNTYQDWFDKRKNGKDDLTKYMKYLDFYFSPESQDEAKSLESASCEGKESTVLKSTPPNLFIFGAESERPKVDCAMFEVNKKTNEELEKKKNAAVPDPNSATAKLCADFTNFKFS